MTPAPAGEEPEQGRGQPVVPLFSGPRVFVVVFNERRSIELDPAAERRSAGGILENHDPRGLSMRRCGERQAPTASRGRHYRITTNRFGWASRMHAVFETYLHALRLPAIHLAQGWSPAREAARGGAHGADHALGAVATLALPPHLPTDDAVAARRRGASRSPRLRGRSGPPRFSHPTTIVRSLDQLLCVTH
jgi:hypothetical protein